MRRIPILLAALLLAPGLALGQSSVMFNAPFQRVGDPFVLPATTTPQQYQVTQPATSASYRGFQPCIHADVRIRTVSPLEPVVSVPTPYPGVRRVTSRTEVVTEHTGTRLARGPEILGSTVSPTGPNRLISIMLVPIPGYPADISGVTCLFELGYGMGGAN